MVVLFILFTIISFLTIDYFVTRAEQRRGIVATPRVAIRSGARRGKRGRATDPAALPGGVFVSPGHVWLKVEPSGTVAGSASETQLDPTPAGRAADLGSNVEVLVRRRTNSTNA